MDAISRPSGSPPTVHGPSEELARIRGELDDVERQRALTSIGLSGTMALGTGIASAWFLTSAPGDFLGMGLLTLVAGLGSTATLIREIRHWNPRGEAVPRDPTPDLTPRQIRERLAVMRADIRTMEGRPGIPRGETLRPGLLGTVGGAAILFGTVLLLGGGAGGWLVLLPGLFFLVLELVERRGLELRHRLRELEERIASARNLLPPTEEAGNAAASLLDTGRLEVEATLAALRGSPMSRRLTLALVAALVLFPFLDGGGIGPGPLLYLVLVAPLVVWVIRKDRARVRQIEELEDELEGLERPGGPTPSASGAAHDPRSVPGPSGAGDPGSSSPRPG